MMLLRSSSTPVLGSLVSSLSDSPSVFDNNGRQSSCSENLKRLSFSHGGHSNFHRFSCNSSPASQTFEVDQESGGLRGFRRAQSDGNLQGLAEAIDVEDLHVYNPTRTRRRNSNLETIPSFSVYNSRYEEEEEEEDDDEGEQESEQEEFVSDILQRSSNIDSSGAFSFDKEEISDFGAQTNMMQTINPHLKEENLNGFVGGVETAPLFLAKGLGIDLGDPGTAVAGGGDGSSFHAMNTGSAGGDGSNIEEYYQRMLQQNPSNPLILSNYAQFLYQSKGDYQRADEYYSRAILVEPGDGDILSQYAKLIWEFHRDRERASNYFEQAVQAAPEDSHVLAAYASFLWETEDDEEDDEEEESEGVGSKDLIGIPGFHGALASAHA